MFSFLKRNKQIDDPLSDLQTVTRWMLELPAGDIHTAQELVVQRLIQYNHEQSTMTRPRLEALMYLDEHARDMQRSLCNSYLRNMRMTSAVESRIWTTIRAFTWEVTRGYHAFVMDYVAAPDKSQIRTLVPLVLARAIRGMAHIIKCSYFRYEPADENLWLRLHNLFRIAETDKVLDTQFKVYKDDAHNSTCGDEYVQALLLSPLGQGSLAPRQIEMVDQWLDNWSHHVRIEARYDAGKHPFHVDTSLGRGLLRIRREHEATSRFINITGLDEYIASVKRALKLGAAPVSLGLGEEFRLPDGYALLELVANEWAPTSYRERRASPRTTEPGSRQVIRDLVNICSHLQTMQETEPENPLLNDEQLLDIRIYGHKTRRPKMNPSRRSRRVGQPARIEEWNIRDYSDTGLGILLRIDGSDWVKAGKLLAFRTDDSTPWQVGVVRRIRRQDEDWFVVGVEVICKEPVAVQIEVDEPISLSYSTAEDGSSFEFDQAVLALRFSESSTDFLIMDAARYTRGQDYRMHTLGATHPIRLEAVRDRGDDWVVAAFSLTA